MRVFCAAILVACLVGGAHGQGLGAHMVGGVTIGDDIPDRRIDNPGFNVGAGLDYGFSENFVLRATGLYTFFPFFSGETPTDVGESVSDGSMRLVEVELLLRLSPRGVTPPGAPILYFLLGTGPGVQILDPGVSGRDDQVKYSFGMAGLGFETKLSGRKRFWFEVVARVTSHEVGAYYPLRVGFRF